MARAQTAARAARRARLRRPGASRGVASKLAKRHSSRGCSPGPVGRTEGRGWGCMVRAVEAQGCGRRPEKTMNMMSMEELAGKVKTKLGKASNGHGFEKRKTRRHRGRRGLPSSGGGCHRERTRWPEKLAEEFAGNLAVENFGVRSAGLRVAARKTGCTFGISASSPTPAYIYV